MYPLIPIESLAGAFEALCYFFSLMMAALSYFMLRPV